MSFPTLNTGQLDARLAYIPDIEGVSIINGAAYPPPGGLPTPLPNNALVTGTGTLLPNPLQSSGIEAYQYVAPPATYPPSGAILEFDPANPGRNTLYVTTDHTNPAGGLTALQTFDNSVFIRSGFDTVTPSANDDKHITLTATAPQNAYIQTTATAGERAYLLMQAQAGATANTIQIEANSSGNSFAPASIQLEATCDNDLANVYILTHDEASNASGSFLVSTGTFNLLGQSGNGLIQTRNDLNCISLNGALTLQASNDNVYIGDGVSGNNVVVKTSNDIYIGDLASGNDVNINAANDVNINAVSQVTIGANNGGDTRIYAPSGYNVRIGNNVGGVRIAENAILSNGVTATTQPNGTNDGTVATTAFLYNAFNNPQVSTAVTMTDSSGNGFTLDIGSYISWQTVGKTVLFNGYWQWTSKGTAVAGDQFRLIFPGAVGQAMAARRAGLCIGLIGTGYPGTNNAMFAVTVQSQSYFNCRFFSSNSGTETNALVSHLASAGSISVNGVLFIA
jgi:hypothetical protein